MHAVWPTGVGNVPNLIEILVMAISRAEGACQHNYRATASPSLDPPSKSGKFLPAEAILKSSPFV